MIVFLFIKGFDIRALRRQIFLNKGNVFISFEILPRLSLCIDHIVYGASLIQHTGLKKNKINNNLPKDV